MTRNKDVKRIIRSRMEKTGESYTAARRQVISAPAKGPIKPKAAIPDNHAAVAGMSDEKIAAKTGRTWPEWVRALDAHDAAAMPHRDIAVIVHDKYGVDDWWAQTVTVGYERLKGLRDKGQRRGGAYEANKSKTFAVPVDALFSAWADNRERAKWLAESGVTVRTATRTKTMRLQWPDGTIVALWFTDKGVSKSHVAVAHTKLASKAAADRAKVFWTDRLERLTGHLERSSR